MLNPVENEESSTQEKGSKHVTVQNFPQGQIQKISQEGSKNTYVIIVNKDCIKSETQKGPPVIKHTPVLKSSHAALANHPILQTCSNQSKSYSRISDGSLDSPNSFNTSTNKYKVHHKTEDVKLNLSTINDDDYDSNFSAKNVFLKPDSFDNDSAIDLDFIDSQSTSGNNNSRSFFCERNKMNTYVIPSPLGSVQQQKKTTKQHSFPIISPHSYSGQRYAKPELTLDNSSSSSTARKIFLVTPTSSSNNGGSVLQKSVAYTNEAVPVLGKGKLSSLHQTKANPKAVPTLHNVSPIGNSSSCFVPINSAVSPFIDSNGKGPLTSTPITGEPVNARLHQLRQESASHRPVYVIPSPFTKNTSSEALTSFSDYPDCDSPAPVFVIPPLSTASLNSSSGFISASSSLELPDNSCSFDSAGSDRKCSVELPPGCQFVNPASVTVSDGCIINSPQHCRPIKDYGLDHDSENDPSLTSSQDSETSDISEKVGLNRSLTNIQWLKGMQLKEDKRASPIPPQQPIQWKNLTPEEIKKISADCGREQRPPFSYMSMIQMALYSREDRKMMLKEICKWIEETFPYYKYTAKPGWKNSIRHNLSLYNIFEREPAKRHGSYWTIKPDIEPRTKQYKERNSGMSSNSQSDAHKSTPSLPSQTQGGVIPIIPMYSSMGQLSAISPKPVCLPNQYGITATGKKKGPPPILPRPSPYAGPQAYALIPISGVSPANMSSSPQVIVNLSNPGSQVSSACPSPGISEMSAAVASIQMSCSSPIPPEQIESNINREHIYTKKPHLNIVKQAWLDSQSMDTASSVDSDIVSSNDIASSSELGGSRTKSKRPRDKINLPKPMIYQQDETKPKLTGSKRRKLQQKERSLLDESSDEEDDGTKFISKLEKEIEIDMLSTSTPLKTASPTSSQLPSPIPGLTPLRNNSLFELDGSFLDSLVDKKEMDLSPESSGFKKTLDEGTPPYSNANNMSLIDLNDLGFTSPDKMGNSPDMNASLSNQNLSKILLDYSLDAQHLENPEAFPHLNWSIMQQMVDGMDVPDKSSF